ncbi:MAG: FAD-dependent oxidoreductase [Microbacteriaceae bacterium]
MSFTRRTFLLGAGSGLSLLVLAACTDGAPKPKPTLTPTPLGEIPKPSSFLRSNWAKDPYARGSTSYLRVGGLPQARETLREPILDRVFLAGEAISENPGTIRGAMESGAAAARNVYAVAKDADRIAIIGAGVAGAEAARLLSNYGANVVVIEARDRVGGRIDSRTTAAGSTIELGAWRLEDVADEMVIRNLTRAGVELRPLTGASAFAPDAATAAAGDPLQELPADDPQRASVATALAGAIEWARKQAADVSVADAITGSGLADTVEKAKDDSAVVLQSLLAELAAMTGADASATTSWFASQAPATPSSVAVGPMSTLVASPLDAVDPALSTVVVAVFYDEDRVSLRLGTGESLGVDRVIVTVPIGVLQQQAIEFDPPLPLLHRGALDQLAVGNVEVLALEFEKPFWTTDAVLWFREDDEEIIRLWINLQPITGQNVLLGVLGGDAALAISELDDGALLKTAQRSLAPFA